jgi:hypothetical protein
MKKIFFAIIASTGFTASVAQSIGVNTLTPHPKAVLDVVSSDKGVLLPRITETARTTMFPASDTTAKGMLVYQHDNNSGFYYYTGYAWNYIGNSIIPQGSAQWVATGANMFNQNTGNVGINTPTPSERLDVKGNINIPEDSSYKIGGAAVLRLKDNGLNLYVGRGAGAAATGGNYNLFTGSQTAGNNTGYYNSIVGQAAGFNNTSGSYNTFLGAISGQANTTGTENTFIGYAAGSGVTTNGGNTFVGHKAGMAASTSFSNVAIGKEAGMFLMGGFNTVVGTNAARSNTNGIENTALGYAAAYNNQNGNQNTSIGFQAGFNLTSGSGNTFIGYQAGKSVSTLNHSTLIGEFAGAASNVKYATAIGTGAYVKVDSAVVIGDTLDHIGVGIKVPNPHKGAMDVNARVIYEPEDLVEGVNHPEVFYNWQMLKYARINAKSKTYYRVKLTQSRQLQLQTPNPAASTMITPGTATIGQVLIIQNHPQSNGMLYVTSQSIYMSGCPQTGLYFNDGSEALDPGETMQFIFDGEYWRGL